tara:strand:+ start:285 stop:926 length:642 start_codon:yes stop_codon:yes gene_type:complete
MKKNQNKYLYKKKLEFLKHSKFFVAEKGLSSNIFKNVAKQNGLNLIETELLFPEGVSDFVEFALEQLSIELEDYCKQIDLIRLPIHKRIRKVLLSKVYLMNKEKIFYKKIFINLLIPKKNLSLPLQLYKSVDQIWFIAGDSSVDFNFYTKRLILSGIYSRVMLFFFNNNSQEALEKVLDSSLKKVTKIPELKSKFKLFTNSFPKVFKFIKNSY